MHQFDPEIAKIVGVNAAVIYQNIIWWTEKNAANERHFYEGRYWTYNSVKAFDSLFPYLTPKQIRTAISKLEETGMIVSGNFNQSAYDRTKWYSPVEQIHLPKSETPFAQKGKPIPDSKPVNKPDMDMSSSDDSITPEVVVEAWNDLADDAGLARVAKLTPQRRKQVIARLKEYPPEDWSKALTAIYNSKFLRGENDRGWKANFDFLLQPSSFVKLIEGAYNQ